VDEAVAWALYTKSCPALKVLDAGQLTAD